jgi:hypothetical protein
VPPTKECIGKTFTVCSQIDEDDEVGKTMEGILLAGNTTLFFPLPIFDS